VIAAIEYTRDDWISAGVLLLVCLGLLLSALMVGLVIRLEKSDGLDDELDRE
jgi:hypothetical protein